MEGKDYQAEGYTWGDLSEEVSVKFADRWPTGKPISSYELICASDPALKEPILLRCDNQLFIPNGTNLLPFVDIVGLKIKGKTFWASHAQLINPELASFIEYDWEYKAPNAMEGRVIKPHHPDKEENEFLKLLIKLI